MSRPDLFCLAAFALQGTVREVAPDASVLVELCASDPVLEGHGPARTYRVALDFSGKLCVWAASEEAELLVRVEDSGGRRLAESDGDGGARTPCVTLEAEPGRELLLTVAATGERGGTVDLRLVSAPETDGTLDAARALEDALDEAARLRDGGQPEAARELLRALLEEVRAVPGAGRSPAVAAAIWRLGELALLLDDLPTAEFAFERVLAQRARCLPSDHPRICAAKFRLAEARYRREDLSGALGLLEDVHAVQARVLKPGDPDLLRTKLNLAVTRFRLGDSAGARVLEEKVLAEGLRRLSPEHPDAVEAMHNLAGTRAALGDFAAARTLLEEVLATWTRLPDPGPELLDVKQSLAAVLALLGDLAGARELQEEVLATWARLVDAGHPELLRATQNLARTTAELGDVARARALLVELLAGIRERTCQLRSDSPRVARQSAAEELQRLSDALFLAERCDPEGALAADLLATLEGLRDVSVGSVEAARAVGEHGLEARRRSIAALKARLADLAVRAPAGGPELGAWSGEFRRLAAERDRLERELRAALGETGVFVDPVDIGSITAALAPGARTIHEDVPQTSQLGFCRCFVGAGPTRRVRGGLRPACHASSGLGPDSPWRLRRLAVGSGDSVSCGRSRSMTRRALRARLRNMLATLAFRYGA